MRRAEKAGRERAEAWIASQTARHPAKAPPTPERVRLNLAQCDPPHQVYSPTHEEIGAHQLTGRALQAALEAYDRGYRARLKEALATLT